MELKDMVDKAFEGKTAKELLDAPISALEGISDAGAKELEKVLKVKTIGELADSKFVQWAQEIKKMAAS